MRHAINTLLLFCVVSKYNYDLLTPILVRDQINLFFRTNYKCRHIVKLLFHFRSEFLSRLIKNFSGMFFDFSLCTKCLAFKFII